MTHRYNAYRAGAAGRTRAKVSLFLGAALGVLLAAGAAHADTPHGRKAIHRRAAHAGKGGDASLRSEVEQLRSSLAAESSARTQMQQQMQVQIDQANATAKAAQDQLETAQAQDADATAAIIQSIPTAIAIATEIDKVKPKTDALYFKGVKITPGGFVETANVYRQRNLGNDISTAFNTVPFPQTRSGHLSEDRFTPRQSRVAALVEGKPTKDVTLSMYGEFDFQGAAQTANSNETNSYNPRIRHLYGTVDWSDLGLHFLAGQTFSLVTLDSKGITPRNEVTPLTIDGQYNVGFTWTRQPGVRITKDLFDKTIWLAVSAENPQTTFTGAVPAGVINTINNGQGFYAGDTGTLATTTNATTGAVTAVSGVAPATQSVNHVPDFIAKAAAEEDVYGHHVHAEVFGIARSFYEQLGNLKTNDITTGAVGAGVIAQVIPGWFDVQASGMTGKGIGRYGSGQLPDATFNTNGHIEPIGETIALVGGTFHATKSLDIWAYGGEEHENRAAYGTIGYGNPAAVDTGCETEASTLPCSGNTKLLEELSAGFWQKAYQGDWGQLRIGLQYSYIERNAFSGVGGAPDAHENMLYTSFRYYPFQ